MELEILREAAAQVEQQLDIDNITVERAVFGLFFSGVKLSARAMPLFGRVDFFPAACYN